MERIQLVDRYESGNPYYMVYYINSDEYRDEYYYKDGSIQFIYFFKNDQLHREVGPSSVHYREDGSISYMLYTLNGLPHRLDGPAYI